MDGEAAQAPSPKGSINSSESIWEWKYSIGGSWFNEHSGDGLRTELDLSGLFHYIHDSMILLFPLYICLGSHRSCGDTRVELLTY